MKIINMPERIFLWHGIEDPVEVAQKLDGAEEMMFDDALFAIGALNNSHSKFLPDLLTLVGSSSLSVDCRAYAYQCIIQIAGKESHYAAQAQQALASSSSRWLRLFALAYRP